MVIGLDTNILCYALDPAYPEHEKLKHILFGLSSDKRVAINPTILHEAYHTLVFGQKFTPSEARGRLTMIMQHPYIEFYNQTRRICLIGINLAVKHGFGGRDAIIIANFVGNKISIMYTHDQELLSKKKITWKNHSIELKDPLLE